VNRCHRHIDTPYCHLTSVVHCTIHHTPHHTTRHTPHTTHHTAQHTPLSILRKQQLRKVPNSDDLGLMAMGLAMCFFGGRFQTLIAAAEAYRRMGWGKSWLAFQALKVAAVRALDVDADLLATSGLRGAGGGVAHGVPSPYGHVVVGEDGAALAVAMIRRKLQVTVGALDPKDLSAVFSAVNLGLLGMVRQPRSNLFSTERRCRFWTVDVPKVQIQTQSWCILLLLWRACCVARLTHPCAHGTHHTRHTRHTSDIRSKTKSHTVTRHEACSSHSRANVYDNKKNRC
jgi:hypothetical protein